MIKLKNGSQEKEPEVTMTLQLIKVVRERSPKAFEALVIKCRRESDGLKTKITEDCLTELVKFSLCQPDGKVHQTIKNIVLSAVEGDDMKIVSPKATIIPDFPDFPPGIPK